MADWQQMSAAALGRGIGAGEIDPVALTEHFLAAIDSHPDGERIYARLTPDRARAEATAARQRAASGQRRGLLDGVPLSWKDLFDTAGTATEAGSRLLAGRVPDRDAAVLQAAKAAGTVCLGKTHLSELAFSGLGLNPMTATPPNVNDPGAVPGGSSSGAAASVAFGLAPAAIGSDTGGSVRVPSAWNDLVGLKPAHGRLSLAGSVPLCARFDTIGPLARTVEDAAEVFAVLAGTPAPDLRGASLDGRRLAVLRTFAFDDIDDAPNDAFEAAIGRLSGAGARIETLELASLPEAMALSGLVFTAEAYGTWRETIEANPDAMFPEIRDRFRLGKDRDAADYVAAWAVIDRVRAEWAQAAAGFDAILCPTVPVLPPNIDRLGRDGEYYVRQNLMALRNTRIGNMMGLAALTLPTGRPSCGVSLMGAPGSEARLLRLGAAAEAALA
jgi:aspartyl-tRNA(Asn)/glutamyl-tRNA(Gln) amidotransferase subunit A